MFIARFTAITAATLLTGVAVAAFTSVNPFQTQSPKVDEHKIVMQAVGEWEGTIAMNMPGMEKPMVMPCSESIRGVGDLWTVSSFTSNFMGTAFQGSSTFGYDVERKKFVSIWVDSMTTTITNMEGVYDAETNSITSDYTSKNPETGEMTNKRSVCIWDAGGYVCKFYDVGKDEVLMMTIDMKRKKVVEASADSK